MLFYLGLSLCNFTIDMLPSITYLLAYLKAQSRQD